MSRTTTFSTILALSLWTATSLASPINVGPRLVSRANNFHLNCSNAPGVTAGNQVSQSDVVLTTNLPESGSNQQWLKYLWCTPNTQTYTFFDFGQADPYPAGYYNVYEALNQAHAAAESSLLANGDGPLYGWDNANSVNPTFAPATPHTGADVYVHDHVGHLTWGILEAALRGLVNAAQDYDKGNYPMVFQINDGAWGEVGTGYVGLQTDNTTCAYEITSDGPKMCVDIALNKLNI